VTAKKRLLQKVTLEMFPVLLALGTARLFDEKLWSRAKEVLAADGSFGYDPDRDCSERVLMYGIILAILGVSSIVLFCSWICTCCGCCCMCCLCGRGKTKVSTNIVQPLNQPGYTQGGYWQGGYQQPSAGPPPGYGYGPGPYSAPIPQDRVKESPL
jgi:hypothetical protein